MCSSIIKATHLQVDKTNETSVGKFISRHFQCKHRLLVPAGLPACHIMDRLGFADDGCLGKRHMECSLSMFENDESGNKMQTYKLQILHKKKKNQIQLFNQIKSKSTSLIGNIITCFEDLRAFFFHFCILVKHLFHHLVN